MTCRLTVLMTVYNGAPYLRTAIDSILQQTYQDFHFLIVDDGSTDETRDIIRSYSDRRIELISLDRNIGQTASLNVGLRHTSTPWIARMDADDYSAPTRLEEQVRALDVDKSLNCIGTFAWWFCNDPKIVESIQTRPERHAEIKRALLQGSSIIHGSIVVSRTALLDVGGYNERYRYSADLELYDRLFAKYRAGNVPKPLIGLRRHPQQSSRSRIAIEEAIDIFNRRLSNGYCPSDIKVIRTSLSVSYLQRARLLRNERKYFEMLKDIVAAFQASPRTFVWHVFRVLVLCWIPNKIRAALKQLWVSLVSVKSQYPKRGD